MHGLAHGMIPDVMEIVHSVFKKYGKLTAFIKFANPTLNDVAHFQLDYCKLKILPKAAWVGENSMGFMRLMSYLYGMFLLNHPLGQSDEAKITTAFLKCFINSFQAYVSILMSKRPVDPEVLEGHMKLFMSAAHYLHRQHGKLDKKKNNQNGPGTRSQLGMKGPKFMDTQSEASLRLIATKMDVNTEGLDKKAILKRFTAMKVDAYLEQISKLCQDAPGKYEELGLSNGDKFTKDNLIELVYEEFVKPELRARTKHQSQATPGNCDCAEEETDEWAGVEKAETMCWNRGNWLSFLINMKYQTWFLGQLHLIW